MRAIINSVNVGALAGQPLAHTAVHCLQFAGRNKSLGNTALIADHDDLESGMIQLSDGILHAGEKMHLLPTGDVAAFPGLAIDHAVTIEKHGFVHGRSFVPSTLR